MPPGRARVVHAVTALVATFAVVLQLVLVAQGHKVLDEVDPPDVGTRLVRFASYLTIWSNVLVAVTTALLPWIRSEQAGCSGSCASTAW